MSTNLSIKNVPDDVVRSLRSRALRNGRSLQEELRLILIQAAESQAPLTLDDVLAEAERQRPGLEETASRVRSAQDAKLENTARRFEDLLAQDDDGVEGHSR